MRRCLAKAFALAVLLPTPLLAAAIDVSAELNRYCRDCHNAEDWAGGVDLTSLDAEQVSGNPEVWEKVVRKLRAGMMPPPGKARPSRQHAADMVTTLAARLDAATAPAPRTKALHRLNRAEYANAIRDILNMPIDASLLLPPDDASEGFDNNAAGLGLSPALIQAYTSAAMKLSRLAVGDMTAGETTRIYQAPENLAQDKHLDGLPLGSRGGLRIEHDFPLDAQYHFNVRGSFALARSSGVIDFAVDGKRVEVKNLRDFRLQVPAGRHTLTAAIFDTKRPTGVNDIYPGFKVEGAVDSIEITGPFNATGPGGTRSRHRIFLCKPQAAAEQRACAERILLDIATHAFRGPQTPAGLVTIMQFYERGHAEGGFESGIQQALSRILIDPRFLFRFENLTGDLSLASRLSFFLWSSIPDYELLMLAAKNELHRPNVLEAQVKRMLIDQRAYALVENFAGQWLHLRELATVTPEVAGFDENLRAAFIEETRRLVDWVRTADRPVTELLTANYSFLNERLARHYGIPDLRGSHFRKVIYPANNPRRGLLGHGSILTVTSTASRTSPVIRGSWILENLLSAPVPAPPPGVETNIDGDGTQVITASMRQRLQQHRKNPSCASCHDVMDPVGFALENFNAIGAWREKDGDTTIDASGTLVDGTRVVGPLELTQALVHNPELFVTSITEKLLIYARGRALDAHDMPVVREIVRKAQSKDLRFSALILGVALATQE
jgi:Protein of unknown function (DUF1592)/Protein of unknown function (DUF1588)/Protein of unknown function (DUF1587)/Protein of unknown function (DUF1585)/Protein of unknown function (DUF1595)/Planctomycete cytochrome C